MEAKADAVCDIVFGIVGFFGWEGATIATIYFIVDTYVDGGWPTLLKPGWDSMMTGQKINTPNGIHFGTHNLSK